MEEVRAQPLQVVRDVLTQTSRGLGGPLADAVRGVQGRLDSPIRLLVAGRVSVGKSTLVNALLRQRVARTDAGPCTQAVVRYAFGSQQRAVVHCRDGQSLTIPLTRAGRLPASLPVPPQEVVVVDVFLASRYLAGPTGLTLVDTPGLSAVDQHPDGTLRQVLDGLAHGDASPMEIDAVVFVLGERVHNDEINALRDLRERAGGRTGGSVSAIGVVTKADLFRKDDHDPMLLARQRACQHAVVLRDLVSSVLPVSGLLAETGATSALREDDAAALEALAGELGGDYAALDWRSSFLQESPKIGLLQRRRLMSLLDVYGLRSTVQSIDGGARGAVQLSSALVKLSGIEDLRCALRERLRGEREALRAGWALQRLSQLTFAPGLRGSPGLAELGEAVEALTLSTSLHRLRELELRYLAETDGFEDAGLSADALRLTGRGTLAERLDAPDDSHLADSAGRGVARWRRYLATAPSPRQARSAYTAIVSYEIAWDEVEGGARDTARAVP